MTPARSQDQRGVERENRVAEGFQVWKWSSKDKSAFYRVHQEDISVLIHNAHCSHTHETVYCYDWYNKKRSHQ